MKIAFVVQKIAGRNGGAERVLIETANEMARRGHQVEILAHENRGIGPFYTLEDGVVHRNLFKRPIEHVDKERYKKFERFRDSLPISFPGVRLYKWHLRNGQFIKDLRQYILEQKPDVLVPFMPPAMIASAYATKDIDVPIVASTHNAPEQDYENPERWDPNPVDIQRRRRILERMTRILVLLPKYREWYPSHLHEKIIVVPNPVQQLPESELNAAGRQKRALFVGRMAHVKRPLFMVKVWKRIIDEFPDWSLDFFGGGPLEHDVDRATAAFEFTHPGRLRYRGVTSEISKEYLASSLLCHPAEYEGFPLAVSEALAHGLPVVGFKSCSGLNALVEDGVNGVLVEDGKDEAESIERWVDALRKLLSSDETLARLSKNAPASVASYAPVSVYDQWEEILHGVTEAKERGGARLEAAG
ncbi:glycosyltransferase [Aquamicrobium sp. LC103]|uniref:glycosyltransferase n=1 Tax=Aquamicrobium sp. LC103 TaxID=1120658 RepID=UPI00063EBE80|nr:glycosyltransferase [Aquamicrobium sp. LC103]TKT80299.1 glycosyltransferase family 4 protein [Aquamicrobium sp. LC103]